MKKLVTQVPNEPDAATLKSLLPSGPCELCGIPTYAAAHRIIDAIRDRYRATLRHPKGAESLTDIAEDYDLPLDVVTWFALAPIRLLAPWRRIKA